MQTHFSTLTQQNLQAFRQVPSQGNIINVSTLQQISCPLTLQGFSIKYAVHGQENYRIDGQEYRVSAGNYLLTNPNCQGSAWLDSPSLVTGICINIQPELFKDLFQRLQNPDALDPDGSGEAAAMLLAEQITPQYFQGNGTRLGHFLKQFSTNLRAETWDQTNFDPSTIYALAELFVGDYQSVFKQILGINAVKSATKQELHRRVSLGRAYMESCFVASPDIGEIARQANLSEYHFFRIFKAVYGVSPHQFMLQKRLDLGFEWLQKGHSSVTEAAEKSGFADVYSFSKSFKKRFGVTPSQFWNR